MNSYRKKHENMVVNTSSYNTILHLVIGMRNRYSIIHLAEYVLLKIPSQQILPMKTMEIILLTSFDCYNMSLLIFYSGLHSQFWNPPPNWGPTFPLFVLTQINMICTGRMFDSLSQNLQ